MGLHSRIPINSLKFSPIPFSIGLWSNLFLPSQPSLNLLYFLIHCMATTMQWKCKATQLSDVRITKNKIDRILPLKLDDHHHTPQSIYFEAPSHTTAVISRSSIIQKQTSAIKHLEPCQLPFQVKNENVNYHTVTSPSSPNIKNQ